MELQAQVPRIAKVPILIIVEPNQLRTRDTHVALGFKRLRPEVVKADQSRDPRE
jgi:hypothetical protein